MFTVHAVINTETFTTLAPVVRDVARQITEGLPEVVAEAARYGLTVDQFAWGKVIEVAAKVVTSEDIVVNMLSPLGVTTYGRPS